MSNSWFTIRLGASVEELAKEMYESIMGWEGEGGHKPPRPDIQKMKDVYDLYTLQGFKNYTPEEAEKIEGAKQEWQAKYALTLEEGHILDRYEQYIRAGIVPNYAFVKTYEFLMSLDSKTHPEWKDESEAKKAVGQALKKREESGYFKTYRAIRSLLQGLLKNHPESYKLWPWAVKQIKEQSNNPQVGHITDIVGEGGKLLDQLRRENKTPQNMDVNKMNFKEFEEWLMQWKKDNRKQESQGEVVYKFHDDWTIQRLTTPEQLQYEGDEMGHCVGGYSSAAESGDSVIYSLRDPKGEPHVTMEIEGMYVPSNQQNRREQATVEDSNMAAPHSLQEGQGRYRSENYDQTTGILKEDSVPDRTFQIVQIQGRSNQAPKPEYQRKIKEFLDSMRTKGVNFERSENWYGNWDDGGYNEEASIENASQLDDWFTDYKANPEKWQGTDEDAYGMQNERQSLDADPEELIIECCASLIDDYDRDRWKTSDWKGLAQATYHMWSAQMYQSWLPEQEGGNAPQIRAKETQKFQQALEKAQDEVWEWQTNYTDSYWDNGLSEEIDEKYEAMGGELNEHDEPKDQDLYDEARQSVEDALYDSYSGDANRYLNYLGNLLDYHGVVPMSQLPDPNLAHGGLPSYDDMTSGKYDPKSSPLGVPLVVPGALSSWSEWKTVKPVLTKA